MATRFADPQRLRAARAFSPSRFCVAIHEMQPDDPFSILLDYDGTLPQPWTRIDVRRNVTAIEVAAPGTDAFAALSDEGDVYFLTEGARVEKIPGAGLYSDDATGLGQLHALALLGTELHATGEGGQFYRRVEEGVWESVAVSDDAIRERGRIEALAQDREGVSYAVGMIAPRFVDRPQDLQEARLRAAQAGDLALFQELSRQADEIVEQEGGNGSALGFMLKSDGSEWSRMAIDTEAELRSIFVEAPDRVWAVGTSGAILSGDPSRLLSDLSFIGDREFDLVDVTSMNGQIVIASDYALHTFDGHVLSPMRPTLDLSVNGGTPTPIAIQGFGETLVYFDSRHGIHLYEGGTWREIEIPDELLQREFKGILQ